MDYFQGVVTEYLRADRAMFVNTELCIQINVGANPDTSGPHWYCDAVAVNFRTREIFLCEVTYAKAADSLMKRLDGWASNWPRLKAALVRDCDLPADWNVTPWAFVPAEHISMVQSKIRRIERIGGSSENMPTPIVTALEDVLPWKYKSWNRLTHNGATAP